MNTNELPGKQVEMPENAYIDNSAGDNHSDIIVLAGEFLANLLGRNFSECSIKSYTTSLNPFKTFVHARGKRKAVEITSQDIVDYRLSLIERGLKQNSIHIYMRAAGLFLRYLHEHDYIFVNPAEGLERVVSDNRLQPVPTEEEIAILLSLPDTTTTEGVRDRAMLEVLYSTAMRNGEAASINLTDVDLLQSTIRVMGKGLRERVTPLGNSALDWLKSYLEVRDKLLCGNTEEKALWLNTRGRRLGGQWLCLIIKRYARSCKEIKTHISTHSLRRACATHMLRRGASPLEIQMLLGHADMSHLRSYLRLSIFDLKTAHQKTRVGE